MLVVHDLEVFEGVVENARRTAREDQLRECQRHTRQLLVDAGFTYVNGGNAEAFGVAETAIVVPDSSSESLQWGADIATALGVPTSAVQVATTGQSVADVIVVLGHNDAPVVPGAGSAIFLHLARDDFSPTQGCVALARDDLLAVLREARTGDAVRVIG